MFQDEVALLSGQPLLPVRHHKTQLLEVFQDHQVMLGHVTLRDRLEVALQLIRPLVLEPMQRALQ